MLSHYLLTAVRNVRRHRLTTVINVLGLAMGLACFILAYALVEYLQASERTFPGADRMVVITVDRGRPFPITAGPVAKHLRADFPELEAVARAIGGALLSSGREEFFATVGETTAPVLPLFVDADFLELFAMPFAQGGKDALRQPNSAVLKEDFAQRLFGTTAVLGRQVRLNGRSVMVTGVIRNIPQPSHLSDSALSILRFEALVSMDVQEHFSTVVWGRDSGEERWNSYQYLTYARLPADGSLTLQVFNERLADFDARHVPAGQFKQRIGARPVSEVVTLVGDATGASTAVLLLGLGGLVLIVACLNFANLATAQAARRGMEIGVRKALGASRGNVARQYAIEAALLVSAALGIALAGVALAAWIIRNALGMDLSAVLVTSPGFWGYVALIVTVVGVLAGAYPALVLSRQRPARVMQSAQSVRRGFLSARLLVGVQFAVTSLLLIGTLIMMGQNRQLQQRLREQDDPVVAVTSNIKAAGIGLDTFRSELERSGKVISVSAMRYVPWSLPFDAPSVARSGEPSAKRVTTRSNSVAHDFFATFDMQLLAGRVFADTDRDEIGAADPKSRTRAMSSHVVIDRMLTQLLGFSSPHGAVGATLYVPSPDPAQPAEQAIVIGVIEDKPLTVVSMGVSNANMYVLAPARTGFPVVRIPRHDVRGGLAAIESAWKRLAPDVPFRYAFADELFERSYRRVEGVSRVFATITLFAFAIATTGLIGMAVHIVGSRRREVGIRKTLGASETRVLSLLLWDFSKPVLIANVLMWPIGFGMALVYSSFFMERAPLSPVPFVLGLCVTVAIAWSAVGVQAWRTARLRPAGVLRYE